MLYLFTDGLSPGILQNSFWRFQIYILVTKHSAENELNFLDHFSTNHCTDQIQMSITPTSTLIKEWNIQVVTDIKRFFSSKQNQAAITMRGMIGGGQINRSPLVIFI